MPEHEKPYKPQPIVPREYVPHTAEYSPWVAKFPFSFHARRDGEPLYPRVVRPEDYLQIAAAKSEEAMTWIKWAYQQPDFYLLEYERSLFERIQHSRAAILEPELGQIKQQWLENSQKLREQGHGALLDTYWPHLAQFETPEK